MGFDADTGAVNTTAATMAASRDPVAAARTLVSAGTSAHGGICAAPVGAATGALEVAAAAELAGR
jgi:hypothetical protein